MAFEDLIKIVGPIVLLLTPLFTMMFQIQTRLARIEKQLELDKERIEEILDRHDRHINDIRRGMTDITLLLARKGINDPQG